MVPHPTLAIPVLPLCTATVVWGRVLCLYSRAHDANHGQRLTGRFHGVGEGADVSERCCCGYCLHAPLSLLPRRTHIHLITI
jgi:hypothetical protein